MNDIIIIYNAIDIGDDVFNIFNTIQHNIFYGKRKNNDLINVLDISIQKIIFHNKYKLSFNVYRKPTRPTSKLAINYNSFHSNDHKLTNFRFLLNIINNYPFLKITIKKNFLILYSPV